MSKTVNATASRIAIVMVTCLGCWLGIAVIGMKANATETPKARDAREFVGEDGRFDLEAVRRSGYEGPLNVRGLDIDFDGPAGDPAVHDADRQSPKDSPDDIYWDNSISPSVAGTSGDVYALAIYSGRLVVGGAFTTAGATLANFIAEWDGSEWSTLGAGLDDPVYALTVYNGQLIAAGTFTTAGGTEARGAAAWNGSSWSALGGGLTTPGWVYALTEYDGDLIAAGNFTMAGDSATNSIARWDGSFWHTMGTGANESVYALTVFDGDLIAGGQFNVAGGVTVDHVAAWNGSSWSNLGFGMDGRVLALTAYDNELIAGGEFTMADSASVQYIAAWDGVSWSALNSGLSNSVTALAVYDEMLIVGGWFGDGGMNRIAAWDGASWSNLTTGTNHGVFALIENTFDTSLIVGGGFSQAGGIAVSSIASWDGTEWSSLGTGTNGPVSALTVYDDKLVAGGEFLSIGDTAASHVASWDGTDWTPLGTGTNSTVTALTVYDGDLIVGGVFDTVGGERILFVASWDGSVWSDLGGEPDALISALSVYGGELIAGGQFDQVGATMASKIAAWNGASWSPLGSGVDGTILALAVHHDTLYAAGSFSSAGGLPADNVAAWDGSGWHALGDGTNFPIGCLAVFQDQLVAGGTFTEAGGGSAMKVASWDGSSWHALGSGTNATVHSLAAFQDKLIVGGEFTMAGGMTASGIAAWDGVSWSTLGSGTDGAVTVFCEYDSALAVGGSFTVAGNKPAAYLAQWMYEPQPRLLSTSPTQNGGQVAPDANLQMTFDMDMDQPSLNSGSIVVHASQTGLHSGTCSYDSPSQTVTFDPDDDFVHGERVEVTVTVRVTSGGHHAAQPYVWSFTTASAGDGTGILVPGGVCTVDKTIHTIRAADLDSDGDVDVVAGASDSLYVFLNNGFGSFGDKHTYYAGSLPTCIGVGDFNADGYLDLLAPMYNDDSLAVFLNDTDAGFDNRITLSAGHIPFLCVVSDFNGSGYPDVAVSHDDDPDSLRLYTNDGFGNFDNTSTVASEMYAHGLGSGDLDNDYDIDMAAGPGETEIGVHLSPDFGVLGPLQTYSAGGFNTFMDLIDLNADNYLDVVTVNYSDPIPGAVTVHLNNGDGTFPTFVQYLADYAPYDATVADISGDGYPDIIATAYGESLSIFLNEGDGTFGPVTNLSIPFECSWLTSADFDGDGDIDIAGASDNTRGQVLILRNSAESDFTEVPFDSANIVHLVTADFDLDALTDVAYIGDTAVGLYVAWGQVGDPPLEAGVKVADMSDATLAVFHMNTDTLPDIVAATPSQVYTLINNGNRTFTVYSVPNSGSKQGSAPDLAVGYFNGDAYADVIVTPGQWFNGDGTGALGQNPALTLSASAVDVADFNEDGIDDIVAIEGDSLQVYLNSGMAVFSWWSGVTLPLANYDLADVVTNTDLNNDGIVDVAVVLGRNSGTNDSTAVMFLVGDGMGGLTAVDTSYFDGSCEQITISDVNRDNFADIVVADASTGDLIIVLNAAGIGLDGSQRVPIGPSGDLYFALATADLDRDGQPDFVSGSANGGNVVLSLNDLPDEPVLSDELKVTGYDYTAVAVTDPNGFVIARDRQTVAGAAFYRLDINANGIIDDRAYDYNLQYGEYFIDVSLENGAVPAATLSVGIGIDGSQENVIFDDYLFVSGKDRQDDSTLRFYYPIEATPSAYPLNGVKTHGRRVGFTWYGLVDTSSSEQYHFQLDRYFDSRAPIYDDSTLTAPRYLIPDSLGADSVYYWRVRSYDGFGWSDFSHEHAVYVGEGCCIGWTGNVDKSADETATLADLSKMIDHLFITLNPVPCVYEANVDQSSDFAITLSDLSTLIDHLFISLKPLPPCQ